jgi:hypothetical protein
MKASTLSQASIYQDECYEIIDMSHIMPNKCVGEALLVTITGLPGAGGTRSGSAAELLSA